MEHVRDPFLIPFSCIRCLSAGRLLLDEKHLLIADDFVASLKGCNDGSGDDFDLTSSCNRLLTEDGDASAVKSKDGRCCGVDSVCFFVLLSRGDMDNDDGFILVVVGEGNEKRRLGVDEAIFAFHLSTCWRRDGDSDRTTVNPSVESIVLVFSGDENPVAVGAVNSPPTNRFGSTCFFEIALSRGDGKDDDDSLDEPSAAVVTPLEEPSDMFVDRGDGSGFVGANSPPTELEEADSLDSFRP